MFYSVYLCARAQKAIPLAPIYLFTKQIVATFVVSEIIDPKFVKIVFTMCNFLYVPLKVLPSIKNIFTCALFFLLSFIFISINLGIKAFIQTPFLYIPIFKKTADQFLNLNYVDNRPVYEVMVHDYDHVVISGNSV